MSPAQFIPFPTMPRGPSVATIAIAGAGAFIAWKLYSAWRAEEKKKSPDYKAPSQLTNEELKNQPGIFTASGLDIISNLFKGEPGREFAVTAEYLSRIPEKIGDAIVPGPDSLGTLIHRLFNPGT